MITVADNKIELVEMEDVAEGLREYLQTYVEQYNQMRETFGWIADKISFAQRREWERTIDSLRTICQALDAGFDPIIPPRNWASGQLLQYLAPIPEHVRQAIDRAEPIFNRSQIVIYDPNVAHFSRPKHTDPMAIGFVDLADQRLHFLIGQWDIKSDLAFIKGTNLNAPIRRASRRVNEVVRYTTPYVIYDGSIWQPTTTPTWSVDYNTTATTHTYAVDNATLAPTTWSGRMVSGLDQKEFEAKA